MVSGIHGLICCFSLDSDFPFFLSAIRPLPFPHLPDWEKPFLLLVLEPLAFGSYYPFLKVTIYNTSYPFLASFLRPPTQSLAVS